MFDFDKLEEALATLGAFLEARNAPVEIVTIGGSDFVNGATVLFGTAAGTGVNFVSGSTLEVTVPLGTAARMITQRCRSTCRSPNCPSTSSCCLAWEAL